MKLNTYQIRSADSLVEISSIKHTPRYGHHGMFLSLFNYLCSDESTVHSKVGFGRIMRALPTLESTNPTLAIPYRRSFYCMALAATMLLCLFGINSPARADTLHELSLASDAGLRELDKVHTDAYRALRGILNADEAQQLKMMQINWINALNQELARTPHNQRNQIVMQWTNERTKNLQNIYEQRTGRQNNNRVQTNEVFFEFVDSEGNVREGPGTNYSLIRTPPAGELGKAISKSDRWIKLQFSDGSTGWVHDHNLRITTKSFRTNPDVAEAAVIPERPQARSLPDDAYQEESRRAALLSSDISAHWKIKEDDLISLPSVLPKDLVDRIEQLAPWKEIDPSRVTNGRHPNLRLAYALHNKLMAQQLDMAVMADLLEQGRSLKAEEVPWVGGFARILNKRRENSLVLQQEAVRLIKDGDPHAAESRMQDAVKEYPSASLSSYTTALASYNKLTQDKALRAVDGDWKKPSLPDKELLGKATEHANALRTLEGGELLPALTSLAKGLEASGILAKFANDYEPAGSMDKPHPIRALQGMVRSEKYREMQSDASDFTKPFIDRIKYLVELIGPKAEDYQKLIDQGTELEKEGKYLDAASMLRQALEIEYSKELEKTIHACESKTSGL